MLTVLAVSADGKDISSRDEMFGGDIVSVDTLLVDLSIIGLGVLRDELLWWLWELDTAAGGVDRRGSVARMVWVRELVVMVIWAV